MSSFSWEPPRIIRFWRPLFKLVGEAAEAGLTVGVEAAKFQSETGVLNQTGFGGGGWDPALIEQEMQYLGAGVGPGVF
jgi:hypothetical protein